MKKGVILSVDKHFLTLLTPEGEFHRSKKEKELYEIGKEIYFSPYEIKRSKPSMRFYTRSALVSAIVSILLILSFLPSYFNEKVFAYVTIDINPSIELSLNENLRVVDLYGINKEGLIVIEKIKDWKDTDVTLMTNKIVKATKDSGYTKNKQQILVTTTLLEDNEVLTQKLDKKIESISQQKIVPEADVKVMKATVKERSKAKEQGISTGTYIENKRKKEQKKELDSEESTPSSLKKTPRLSENRAAVERKSFKPSTETPTKRESVKVVPSSKSPSKTKSADLVPSSESSSKTNKEKSKNPVVKTKNTKVVKVKKVDSTAKQKGKPETKKQKAVIQQKNKNQQPKANQSQQINNQKTKENTRSSQSNQKKKETPEMFINVKKEHQPDKKEEQRNKPIHPKKQSDYAPDKRMKGEHNQNERGNEKREYRTPH
ncbi:anti-sigma factor domain-containing protein [Peribacillus sp. FSL H8-0477]|uniref:anti-sigma factor domain-containing protein n=1 Tax=Peribacillus sp. FSL H8-0477 TaxID=2921388 RepID=UPI0030F93CCD